MNNGFKIGGIVLLIGIGFTVSAIRHEILSSKLLEKGVVVKGRVTRVELMFKDKKEKRMPDDSYKVTISYSYQNMEYQTSFLESDPDVHFEVKNELDLLVDPNNPSENFIPEENINKKIIMGPAWILLGLYFLNLAWKDGALLRELRKHGKKTRATVTYVGEIKKREKSEKKSYELKAEFFEPFSGKPITVSIDDLSFHPKTSGFIAKDNTVEVLYDPKDLEKCLINPKQPPYGGKGS
jgi:hypothetical protein